jgi:hypothetical protein
MNTFQRVVRLMALLVTLAVLGLLSLFLTGCAVCYDAVQWPPEPTKPSPAPPPQYAVRPAKGCADDPNCTPWALNVRTDRRDFDRGVNAAGLRVVPRGDVPYGMLQGYDGRIYAKKTCLTHVGGPVCNCDEWEPVPADGRSYTPDLFSRIYHERIAEFYRLW